MRRAVADLGDGQIDPDVRPEPFGPNRKAREKKRHELHRVSKRTHLVRAAMVGLTAGLLGVLYQVAVTRIETLNRTLAAEFSGHFLNQFLFVLATVAVGGTAAHLVGITVPESGGSGIPHVKAALLHLRHIRAVPLLIAKFFGGLAALAAGMSLGREGPTIQMGASAGKLIGDLTGAPRRGKDTLIASGGGAGLAAAFNAPLAGFLFVMEELRREMSALTYGSALIASVFAVAITRLLLGEHSSFAIRGPGAPALSELPIVAILGIVAGLGGVLFNKGLMGALNLRSHFKIPKWIYGTVVGTISGCALLFVPEIAGSGHELASTLLSGTYRPEHLLFVLLAVFLGKLILTSISYGTGLPGGIFAPMLALGAVLGFAFGLVVQKIDPSSTFGPAGYATVGMAALLAGSVRAPLTGVVLIVEMTGEYNLLYSLLICAFAADIIAEAIKDEPIYEALMERDLRIEGAEVHPDKDPILMELLIEPDSAMDGRKVKDLRLPTGAILTTLVRGTRQIVPGGATTLRGGDSVTVLIEGDKPELSLEVHRASKAP